MSYEIIMQLEQSQDRLLPVAAVRLYVEDLHAVGWDEGPWSLVTPVKANSE